MKFIGKSVIPLLICVSLFTGCNSAEKPSEKHTKTFFAMDTFMEITIYGEEEILDEAENIVFELEKTLSVTEPTSEIYRLNHGEKLTLSADTSEILEKALGLCKSTHGALDISIYPIVRAWGFTTGGYRVPAAGELSKILENVDYSRISFDGGTTELPKGMEIDLGSIAKGFAGDKIIELLRNSGVNSALLNLGGNVQALGGKPDGAPWKIALSDPFGEGYAGSLEISDKAVITSGAYERFFEENDIKYHHIMNPKTGFPAQSGLASVTVIAENGYYCDALSTALFVMGLDEAVEFWKTYRDFDAVFIADNSDIFITEGLADIFEPLGNYKSREVHVIGYD